MKTISIFCALLAGTLPTVWAAAEPLPRPENQQPNHLLLDVDGIVCSFCSHGVKKKLSQLTFIDKSQYRDGIYVDIDRQQVLVAIQPGQVVDIEASFKAVRDGGYDPLRACVTDGDGQLECVDAENPS